MYLVIHVASSNISRIRKQRVVVKANHIKWYGIHKFVRQYALFIRQETAVTAHYSCLPVQ